MHRTPKLSTVTYAFMGRGKKRGHSSLNGVVTGISRENGKVLDVQIFLNFYFGCAKWDSRIGTPEYEAWKLKNVCSKNHSATSGAMESMERNIFASSIKADILRYSHYIALVTVIQTESFAKVVNSRPYGPDINVWKLEYVGHVQKRIGTRWRELRNVKKHEKLSDGTKISGKF